MDKTSLPSEQLATDGSYPWYKLIEKTNQRLKQIGVHGKRAIVKVSPKANKPISAQFSLNGQQTQRGLRLPLTKSNLAKAEEICTLITSQLVANSYTDDWLQSLLGKEKMPNKTKKILTCQQMLEEYKKYYFKQRKENKTPIGSWDKHYRHTEKLMNLHANEPISLPIIREIIDSTENNSVTRTYHLNGLVNLLNFFGNTDFKKAIKRYKEENKPKPQKKYIPSDSEIAYVYQFCFEPNERTPKKHRYRYPQWQFLYGLLATYGLRIHEAWNIKNWDNSVTLKNGDWIAIADDNVTEDENEQGKFSYHQLKKRIVIPAILDPGNRDYLLCIGHETKTGYRVAFPICPNGHTSNCKWIKEFNLIQPLNLPDIENPLERYSGNNFICSRLTSHWFYRHKYGFTAHALRHAYNIRGHSLNINQKALANSLGHGLQMNSSNYLRHEGDVSKIQGIQKEIQRDNSKRNEIEKLESKVEKIKAENEYLKAENERLKTELKLYEALKDKL